jgi:hypothetical protein
MSVSSVTVVQSLDLAHLPCLPVRNRVHSDQRLLRKQPIIIKLLAGRIENGQIVVEDIGVKHGHRIAGVPIPCTALDVGTEI